MGLPGREAPRYSRAVPDQRTWTRSELPREVDRALAAALERGGKGPVVLRLTEVAGYADWALLISARSDKQVAGVVEGIFAALSDDSELKLLGSDGLDHNLWALLDYGDFLVHVFYHPVRKHYDLESMWSDAPRVELGLAPELLDTQELDNLSAPDPMPAYRGDLAFGGFEDEFADDEFDGELDDEDDEAPPAETERPRPAPAAAHDDDLFEP